MRSFGKNRMLFVYFLRRLSSCFFLFLFLTWFLFKFKKFTFTFIVRKSHPAWTPKHLTLLWIIFWPIQLIWYIFRYSLKLKRFFGWNNRIYKRWNTRIWCASYSDWGVLIIIYMCERFIRFNQSKLVVEFQFLIHLRKFMHIVWCENSKLTLFFNIFLNRFYLIFNTVRLDFNIIQ